MVSQLSYLNSPIFAPSKKNTVKGKHAALIIALILIADQSLKIFIKTHYYLGEEHYLVPMGKWFRLHFVENEGMAWGWQFGGNFGKLILTLFRLVAVILGTFYLRSIIKKEYTKGFIVCASLIYAGAAGNLLDSMFYGLIFNDSNLFMQNVAHMVPFGTGYAGFLHGKVVDMLYFPIITNTHFPSWIPFWGGQDFEFFRPVFNISDASISVGVIVLLLWQKKFLPRKVSDTAQTVETNAPADDNSQVS